MDDITLVTGAGGFIGGHMTNYLTTAGYHVRAVDIASPINRIRAKECSFSTNMILLPQALRAMEGVGQIYHFAADHGGIGWISNNQFGLAAWNAMLNLTVLRAALAAGVKRIFFPSSVCIYPVDLKLRYDAPPIRECDWSPSEPDSPYGWEKLFAELLMRWVAHEGLETRVARYHTIYGPWCHYKGGTEKVVPALCRKIATSKITGDTRVEIWGNGKQTRTFMYIDDCLHYTHELMKSNWEEPINIGSEELVSIDFVADLIADIAEVKIEKVYKEDAPVGALGRGADTSLMRTILGERELTTLWRGLANTYTWVEAQVRNETS